MKNLITDAQRVQLLAHWAASTRDEDHDPTPVVKLFTPLAIQRELSRLSKVLSRNVDSIATEMINPPYADKARSVIERIQACIASNIEAVETRLG